MSGSTEEAAVVTADEAREFIEERAQAQSIAQDLAAGALGPDPASPEASPGTPTSSSAPAAPVEPEEILSVRDVDGLLAVPELFLPRLDAKGRPHPARPLTHEEREYLAAAGARALNRDFPGIARWLATAAYKDSLMFVGAVVIVIDARRREAIANAKADREEEERAKREPEKKSA